MKGQYYVKFFSIVFFLFFKDFIYVFLERREGIEKEREKHQCVVASHMAPTGDLACNPDMCPDWESNWHPFGSQPMLSPLSYTSQGFFIVFLQNFLTDTGIITYHVLYFGNILNIFHIKAKHIIPSDNYLNCLQCCP